MDFISIISSIVVGLLTSYVVARIFYRFGRTDTEASYRRVILTLVTMRLKQMIPTRRQNVPEHYDLSDTAHWLTCLSEVLAEMEFQRDADCLNAVRDEIAQAPHIPLPSEEETADGEASKRVWQTRIRDRIAKLR
jgi:hypothetical protein